MPAPKGNKYAQEWTLENAQPRFEDALKYAEEDENCLCLQDAVYHSGIPLSTFDYLAKNQIVLGTIKNDIKAAIIRRVNRNALLGIYRDSPSIFRMKNLGEKDESTVTQISTTEIIVSDKQTADEVNKLMERFKSNKDETD